MILQFIQIISQLSRIFEVLEFAIEVQTPISPCEGIKNCKQHMYKHWSFNQIHWISNFISSMEKPMCNLKSNSPLALSQSVLEWVRDEYKVCLVHAPRSLTGWSMRYRDTFAITSPLRPTRWHYALPLWWLMMTFLVQNFKNTRNDRQKWFLRKKNRKNMLDISIQNETKDSASLWDQR